MKVRLGGTNDRTIESLKIFPYIAWGITLCFAFFVYKISTELQQTANDLQTQTDFLESQINKKPSEIESFTLPKEAP
jgi:hypothetical protein